jgi:hypothetical protein
MTSQTRDIWRPEPSFEGHRQNSLKCIKLGLFRTGCMGSLTFTATLADMFYLFI